MGELKKKCGAKTRSGEPCKSIGLENGRCRMHGGKAKPGHKFAKTPGSIYSRFLTPEEQALEPNIELGKLDDEIRLSKLRLRRMLDEEMNHPVEDRDYSQVADRLLARIGNLEKVRRELMGGMDGDDTLDDPNPDV